MRRIVLTLALAVAAALAVLWAAGGFDTLARLALEAQREAQNALAGALRRLRAGEPGALAGLLGLAFAYGVLHAAGPGHGKAVIGAYGAASRVRLARLAGIALAASLGQATVAVALVYGTVSALDWTRQNVTDFGDAVLAPLSAAMIGLVGAWLMARGLRGLWRLAGPLPVPAFGGGPARLAGAGGAPAGHALRRHGDEHDHAPGNRHGEGHGNGHGHHHAQGAGACDVCGHRHGPDPAEVARLTGWRDAALLVAAIAIRPCTGALFLLILTWRMGIEAAGIAGAYAMGLGTAAITVGVAALAVLARDGALHWAGRLGALRPLAPVVELGVGGLVVLLAVQAVRTGL